MNPLDEGGVSALVQLGRALLAANHRFTTCTPATHARVNARPENAEATNLAGVFGWSRPFRKASLPGSMVEQLARAGALIEHRSGLLQSAIRFSSLDDKLFAHSAFPTEAPDSVFFGPDTYRFVRELKRRARPAERAVDLGCGSGAGGLSIAERTRQLICTDVNPRALELTRVNAILNRCESVALLEADLFGSIEGELDLIVANPPYLADELGRTYRDGGGALGTRLSRRIVEEGLPRLRPGGQLILYSATPVAGGKDPLAAEILPLIDSDRFTALYEELDPDVFGEELERPRYRTTERIAVVCLEVCHRA